MEKQLAIAACETAYRKTSRLADLGDFLTQGAHICPYRPSRWTCWTTSRCFVSADSSSDGSWCIVDVGANGCCLMLWPHLEIAKPVKMQSCLAYLCIYKWNQNQVSLRVACKACFSPSRASHSRSYAVVAFNSTKGEHQKQRNIEKQRQCRALAHENTRQAGTQGAIGQMQQQCALLILLLWFPQRGQLRVFRKEVWAGHKGARNLTSSAAQGGGGSFRIGNL